MLAAGTLFSDRLGLHQLAYLRALAQGLEMRQAAERYLGIQHGAAAPRAHQATVDLVRALARRRGDPRWRLIGIRIHDEPEASAQPSLDEWAAAAGVDDGWSEAELLEMYTQALGDSAVLSDPRAQRRQARNERLRRQRLQLLAELERSAVVPARPTDALQGWFAPELAEAFRRRGLLTLQDLQARIAVGGRWYASLRGLGPTKAERIEAHLLRLLAGHPASTPSEPLWPVAQASAALAQLDSRGGQAGSFNHSPSEGGALAVRPAPADLAAVEVRSAARVSSALDADSDAQAVKAWIEARAGSQATGKLYARELLRYRIWLATERGGKGLGEASVEDCRAYMAFLARVPLSWISRRKAAPLTAGWAPFKSQPRLASQALALTAINACHVWLVVARYLTFNPWHLVNRRLGDDPQRDGSDPTSRAFTPAAWAALRDQVAEDGQAKRARDRDSALRNLWLLSFGEACGLRAAELLGAQLKDLVLTPEGWVIKVLGKGRRQRQVPVPSRALAATRAYLATRGIDMDLADPDTPLLAAVGDPKAAISYSALAQAIKSLVQRAARRLPLAQAATLVRATHHWLRHTHATRAAERQVPLDALQENLGQADPRTTARYYRAQIRRRAQLMEQAFGTRE